MTDVDSGDSGPNSAWTSATALWRRAPLWRLVTLTAALLTLIFLLFPPLRASRDAEVPAVNSTSPVDVDTATYTPPHPTPPTTPPAVPPKPSVRPVPPKTATLSMVRANPHKPDESGLDEALIGRLYKGSVAVDGYDVPLPQGEWASMAHSTISLPTANGDAHFLGRIRNKRLVGAVRIFAARSKSQPGEGFPEAKSCTEVNPGRTYVAIDDAMVPKGHQACWTIRTVYATPWERWADKAVNLSALDRAAAGDMSAKGVTYPQDFIALTFTRTEQWGLLEVMYLFSPEAEGISSHTALSVGETDWTPANIDRYPEKVAYVAKLKSFGANFWSGFKAAFDQGRK
jgi:hypothetical protein